MTTKAGTAWIGEKGGRQPRDFEPYLKDRGRWFRTMNDSILTQYGGLERFHHGTVHPTFRAHIAFAEAVADAAFLANPH
jgi:carbamate kinase